jgi:hypothetical protein
MKIAGLRDILPFLLLATGNTKLLLPWDPGDPNIGIRDIMLLLQSVTSDVRLTLPWGPEAQGDFTRWCQLGGLWTFVCSAR